MFVNVFSSPIRTFTRNFPQFPNFLAFTRIFFRNLAKRSKSRKAFKKRSKAFQTRSNTQSNASLDSSKNQPTLQNFN